MAAQQIGTAIADAVFGGTSNDDLYEYQESLGFLQNGFEARANYFAKCMSGDGSCAALKSEFSPTGRANERVIFRDKQFIREYTVTGSLIPKREKIEQTKSEKMTP
ncbi:MAG: hypothetical protein ABJ360_05035 [Roseobacter sp.]|uniref:hypothetical protein n=1 Tax=Parasphingorhabdus sp. TaxID=2709688 RepID=UPI003263BA1D